MNRHAPKSVFDIMSRGVNIPTLHEIEIGIKLGQWLVEQLGEAPDSLDIYQNPQTRRVPDFALVAGILQLKGDSPQIREVFKLAYQAGIEVAFINPTSANEGADHTFAHLRIIKRAQTSLISYQLLEDSINILSFNEESLNIRIK